ncbi:MAG TPA: methyltransferase domain-containing protein [Terriglobales bacterium]|nr:methyltransferase domain-containing protein [Terriglobales bacterium]
MKPEDPGRHYDAKFYGELTSAQESAREVLPIIFEIIKPQSVVDIGCGTGHWLAAARQLGVKEILGVDGRWVRKDQLAISAENFLIHDLMIPLKLPRRFDLAVSLEVAEHLPQPAARNFVQNLCQAADLVLFSAAIPGQGGRRHLNEQWPAYWANLFGEFGYECYDYLRPKIWINPRVTWYYAQNSLIFARKGHGYALGGPVQPLPLVHPGLWSAEVARMRNPGKLLERFFKAILSPVRDR